MRIFEKIEGLLSAASRPSLYRWLFNCFLFHRFKANELPLHVFP